MNEKEPDKDATLRVTDRLERRVQMFFGILMWIGMTAFDLYHGVDFTELEGKQLTFKAMLYLFPAYLITGITIKDVVSLIRAWRQ